MTMEDGGFQRLGDDAGNTGSKLDVLNGNVATTKGSFDKVDFDAHVPSLKYS